MATSPIKRNKNIVSLSKDHHLGLLLCWKIREGLKLNIELERIKKYVHFFWLKHLVDHFEQEETLLFFKVDALLVNQAKEEHESIRSIMSSISSVRLLEKEAFIQLAGLVEQNIRFEERVLFPFLEKAISTAEIEDIGKALEAHKKMEEKYEDAFWIRKVS